MTATTERLAPHRRGRAGAKPGAVAAPRPIATAGVAGELATSVGTPGRETLLEPAEGSAVLPVLLYHPTRGVDDFVQRLAAATPLQRMETERNGVAGRFLKDLSRRMDLPAARVFVMLGVPKATAEKKAAAGETVSGSGGQAAIGLARLLGIAQGIVDRSTAAEARSFDSAKWLGRWLERPQPSLGGRKPGDLLDTPTGIEIVARLLGAIESGAYQ